MTLSTLRSLRNARLSAWNTYVTQSWDRREAAEAYEKACYAFEAAASVWCSRLRTQKAA